ncbi:predicted protein [Nematostella vectensis]|uniref:Uncharacterized protein n=1 Tax=Nematostella vectensis TaxID=45351 RepID=A7S0Y8_NEMVE|nr:predicted protein [Nematostella vectensis]|eukprot:XP_001634729.1 predicted protein [Nematostella vectensis]
MCVILFKKKRIQNVTELEALDVCNLIQKKRIQNVTELEALDVCYLIQEKRIKNVTELEALDVCYLIQEKSIKNVTELEALDVCNLIQEKSIKNVTELEALAQEQMLERKSDLAAFILNRSPRAINDILTTSWEMKTASARVVRSAKSRIEILNDAADGNCVDGCNGRWLECANEILYHNGLDQSEFTGYVLDLLTRGKGKYKNLMLVGAANWKNFSVKPSKFNITRLRIRLQDHSLGLLTTFSIGFKSGLVAGYPNTTKQLLQHRIPRYPKHHLYHWRFLLHDSYHWYFITGYPNTTKQLLQHRVPRYPKHHLYHWRFLIHDSYHLYFNTGYPNTTKQLLQYRIPRYPKHHLRTTGNFCFTTRTTGILSQDTQTPLNNFYNTEYPDTQNTTCTTGDFCLTTRTTGILSQDTQTPLNNFYNTGYPDTQNTTCTTGDFCFTTRTTCVLLVYRTCM